MSERLHIDRPGASAEGKLTADGLVVLAESLARAESMPSLSLSLWELRKTLAEGRRGRADT
jgi:hypothetical protein